MIKIIAVGNRFMKDDGIGIKVAEEISNRFSSEETEIIVGETDFQSSFCFINEDDFVIILDAVYKGSEPGSVYIFNLDDALSKPLHSLSQHDINLIELMKIHNSKNNGCIIGVEVAEVDFGDELSLVLRNKFLQICLKIESSIKDIFLEEQVCSDIT